MKVLLAILFSAVLAQAQSFTKTTDNIDDLGNITVSWAEENIQKYTNVDYSFDLNQTTSWSCVTGTFGNYIYVKNFNYTLQNFGQMDVGPVLGDAIYASESWELYVPFYARCSAGQKLIPTCVVYDNPTITDVTNNVSAVMPSLKKTLVPGAPGC